jgi:hypothetical protein
MNLLSPLLAAGGFEGLVAVAFLVISVIGWVINQAGGQKPQGPNAGAAARPQPKRQQVQSEIDSFLAQATGNRPARGRADVVADDDIEVVEEPRRLSAAPERRPPTRQQPKPAARPQQVSRPQSPRPQQPAQRPQPQPMRTPTTTVMPRPTPTALGQGVRQHVAVHMADQISQRVAQEVPHAIDAMVQQHLGKTSSSAITAKQESLASSIGTELRNLELFRKAVILNEILSPPLSRRNKPRNDRA